MLLDTHALLWLAQADRALGSETIRLIDQAMRADGVLISAISFWETAMLRQKRRIELDRPTRLWAYDTLATPGFRLIEITPDIAVEAGHLPDAIHGDPADRMLIASARHVGVPLLTADAKILDYAAAGHLHAIDARD